MDDKENKIDEYDKQEIENEVRELAELYDINYSLLPLFIKTFTAVVESHCLKALNKHLTRDVQWMRDNWDDDDDDDFGDDDINSPSNPYAEFKNRL
jgi:hypothetical protein